MLPMAENTMQASLTAHLWWAGRNPPSRPQAVPPELAEQPEAFGEWLGALCHAELPDVLLLDCPVQKGAACTSLLPLLPSVMCGNTVLATRFDPNARHNAQKPWGLRPRKPT
ncbi:MAG: hypothetical protein HC848_07990 [Limnobacter sp.]|nr:hypothetical protein [Limnobacter sp.]